MKSFRISPTNIQASTTSVSRHVSNKECKVTPLYKKGARIKRTRQYLRRWLGWGFLAVVTASPAYSAPGDAYAVTACSTTSINNGIAFDFPNTNNLNQTVITVPFFPDGVAGLGFVLNTPPLYRFITYSSVPPLSSSLTPLTTFNTTDEPQSTSSAQTVYVSVGAGVNNEVCTYQYTLSGVGQALTRTNTIPYTRMAAATAVPLFTPLGLIATITGLLWFGRRRSIKLKNS